jgi:divalent metal cation (Fe/Co/Zn/Cd) transporter
LRPLRAESERFPSATLPLAIAIGVPGLHCRRGDPRAGAGDRAETSIIGLVLTAGTAIFEPALGVAKRRIGARLGSPATAGEGTQNLLCAYLAIAVFAGLAANTLLGIWWLDGVVALGIAGWAVVEGRRAWAGKPCGCVCQPGEHC